MAIKDTHLVTKDSNGTKELRKSAFRFKKLSDVLPTLFGAKDTGSGLGVKKIARGIYDFSVNGGAVGSTVILLPQDNLLPDNAIITNVYVDVLTTCTSGGSATVGLRLNSGTDALGATAVASLTAGAIIAGTPDGTAANMVKLTADRNITVVIATAALTAGKFAVFVEYVVSE